MVIDLKYHLTTIVAIFLALAIGILVGSSFIAGSSVKGLEQEFKKLRAENNRQVEIVKSLEDQLKKHTDFEAVAAPLLVSNRLAYHSVAIIQTGDLGDATQHAKEILECAGARIASVTTIPDVRDRSSRNKIIHALEIIGVETQTTDPVINFLQVVADCIASGSNPDAIMVFESKGLLSSAGEYNRRISYVVLVGGTKNHDEKRPEMIDLPLIEALRARGVNTVVGVEPYEVGTSYVPAYRLKQIPTVDNVDQYIGQICLVYALVGESGNFGVKKTANRVVPESLKLVSKYGYRR